MFDDFDTQVTCEEFYNDSEVEWVDFEEWEEEF